MTHQRRYTESINSKYAPFLLAILLFVVTLVATGFSNLISYISAGNIAMLVAVALLEQRTRTMMNKEEAKAIVKFESPLAWLKFCILFSTLSILSTLGYVAMNGLGITTDIPIFGNNSLLLFSIGFFIYALLLFVRASVFVVDPSSKINASAGKILYRGADIAFRIVVIVSLILFQLFNGAMLYLIIEGMLSNIFLTPIMYLYVSTLILSFIAMIPLVYNIVFHANKHIDRRGLTVIIGFYSPWFVLISMGLLLMSGFRIF